ncbi:nucleotidyltransferase domain-containing protein [Methylotuvimicrobium alcaliphilum]|uniref:Nucleotidyltransferase family protein n=1 Tax=Methylotuvimicrobium alcaliphilum (strain DSM 19304 / NCIMB 14124 / VKM B-2133 / 20Z) TaxID=1091494 RepID=G4T2F1_META2|nr:nucleotidyltransferase family protein [Methylotuvimicrobium alcaliphilum]CCE23591.1 conserved protein of unknown function [Methylotuvimicrobium alcaliphilum 20Z]
MSSMPNARHLLLRALTNPRSLEHLELKEWELLVRFARASKLLAALGFKLAKSYLNPIIPPQVQEHFLAAQKLVEYRQRLVMWELNRINKVVASLDVDILVLKGGAYMMLDLDMAHGRSVSDIDILVSKNDIERLENCLTDYGWQTAKIDAYDQHYYRTWMHEIPPMRHRDRFVEVDIHHTILPLTSRLHPDPDRLFKDAVKVSGYDFKVLSPIDMVLHSAAHLFYDAELTDSDFRDLVDLHELLTLFSEDKPEFLEMLEKRSCELQLQRPLYYTFYFSKNLLNTQIPKKLITEHSGRPSVFVRWVMEKLVPVSLLPEHPDYPRKRVALARWLLYMRSHYLRMPLYLLLPHLMKKAKKRLERKDLDELKSQHQNDDT